MKLGQMYRAGTPRFSFEFFPPKSDKGEAALFETVETLAPLRPAYFSVTYGAGGSTREKTITLGHRIKQTSGVDVVCHLTCVGQSRDEVRGVVRQIKALGLENVLALRGDPPRGEENWRPHPDGFRFAAELVREVRAIGGLSVGVAGFPEVHPDASSREADLAFMKEKIDAGADIVITQLFFDNADYHRYVADLRALGVTAPVIAGIMPVLSADQIRRITSLCKSRIPEDLDAMLRAAAGDAEAEREVGVEYAARQIRELLGRGVPGVHIYCLNRADSALAIFRKLGAA